MGFLGKARKMIGGGAPEPPKPQYYQVSCAEGHVIRGERTEGYQALRCPHCGDGVFVLPRSPLPLPPAPASARPKPKPARIEPDYDEDVGIELTEAPPQEELETIQWVDEVVSTASPAPVAPSPNPPGRATARPQGVPEPDEPAPLIPSRSKARPQPAKRRQAAPAAAADLPSGSAVGVADSPTRRDHGAPGRVLVPDRPRKDRRVALVLASVAILAVGAYVYRTRRARLQELPHEAEVNAVEGREALELGHFDEAKIKLGKAAKAYRALHASDELSTQTQQFAEEAAILDDAERNDPKEIVEEVARLGDPEGLSRFDVIHRGRAVLIEGEVESVTPVVQLHYRILVGRGPAPARKGRLDLTGFKLVERLGLKVGDSVTFGARLDSIRLEKGEWLITFQPESGVLITNAKAKAIAFQEVPPS